MKKYLQMSRAESDLVIKMILATLIGNLISWMTGDIYSMTIVVTAYLFLWNDRGYQGNLIYAKKRVLVQIVQGIFMVAIILPCKYWELPIPDIVLITIACCVGLGIGLPLNYKLGYSLFHCTLACATIIIAIAVIRNPVAFPKRVVQCAIGCVVGYFINYVIFPNKDRVSEIMHLTKGCLHALTVDVDHTVYSKNMAQIEKELGFLVVDGGKNGRNSDISEEEIEHLKRQKQLLISLKGYLDAYAEHEQELSQECREKIQDTYEKAVSLHHEWIGAEKMDFQCARPLDIASFELQKQEEICVVGRLLEYVRHLSVV